jgi:hypothetical protein
MLEDTIYVGQPAESPSVHRTQEITPRAIIDSLPDKSTFHLLGSQAEHRIIINAVTTDEVKEGCLFEIPRSYGRLSCALFFRHYILELNANNHVLLLIGSNFPRQLQLGRATPPIVMNNATRLAFDAYSFGHNTQLTRIWKWRSDYTRPTPSEWSFFLRT